MNAGLEGDQFFSYRQTMQRVRRMSRYAVQIIDLQRAGSSINGSLIPRR
jgi:hypothetical protein